MIEHWLPTWSKFDSLAALCACVGWPALNEAVQQRPLQPPRRQCHWAGLRDAVGMFEAVRELLGGRMSQVLGQRALRCCCCCGSLSPPSCCNTSSFSGQQPSWRSCSPRASTHRPPSSSRMAAVLTMRSSLLLLLLLATLDGALAQAEEHGVEELQVETLVSV